MTSILSYDPIEVDHTLPAGYNCAGSTTDDNLININKDLPQHNYSEIYQ